MNLMRYHPVTTGTVFGSSLGTLFEDLFSSSIATTLVACILAFDLAWVAFGGSTPALMRIGMAVAGPLFAILILCVVLCALTSSLVVGLLKLKSLALSN